MINTESAHIEYQNFITQNMTLLKNIENNIKDFNPDSDIDAIADFLQIYFDQVRT